MTTGFVRYGIQLRRFWTTSVSDTTRSRIVRFQLDDCRLVADNSGSFAPNPGFHPAKNAPNLGRISRRSQVTQLGSQLLSTRQTRIHACTSDRSLTSRLKPSTVSALEREQDITRSPIQLLSKMNCIAMSAAYSPSLHPRCAPIGAEPRPKLNLLNEVTVKAAPSMTQAACGSGHSLERVPRHANGYPASAAPIARQNQHSILSAEAKSPFFTFTTWPTLRGGGGS